MMELRVAALHEGAILPTRAHANDAGLDLYSDTDETIEPGQRSLISTGIAVAIPDGCVGLVHPRSGLAHKHGVTVLNAPGTVDAGYRGEVKVNLANLGDQPFDIARGDRIAQLIIQEVVLATVTPVSEGDLGSTARGHGGHGSTGV